MRLFLRSKQAFTLVELIVVITIIGLLAAVGVVSYKNAVTDAKDEKIQTSVESVRISLELFKRSSSAQEYPISLNALSAAQYEVPLHPVTDDLEGYAYSPLPSGCDATGGCASYEIRATMQRTGMILVATPLAISLIQEE